MRRGAEASKRARVMSEKRDYKDTVFLPKTDFPMKAGLPAKEPGIAARWEEIGLYEKLRESRAGARRSSSSTMARLTPMATCISATRSTTR